MRKTLQALAAVTMLNALALNGALAEDVDPLAGAWQVRAFYTEDVVSKERHHVYGAQPKGLLQMLPNGHFTAYVRARDSEPALSVWEDVAYSLASEAPPAIYYSGTYRIDRESLFTQVEYVRHVGPIGTDAFDMSWTEGRTVREEERTFQVVAENGRPTLLIIETRPQPNPNGAGNMIVGRTVWQKYGD